MRDIRSCLRLPISLRIAIASSQSRRMTIMDPIGRGARGSARALLAAHLGGNGTRLSPGSPSHTRQLTYTKTPKVYDIGAHGIHSFSQSVLDTPHRASRPHRSLRDPLSGPLRTHTATQNVSHRTFSFMQRISGFRIPNAESHDSARLLSHLGCFRGAHGQLGGGHGSLGKRRLWTNLAVGEPSKIPTRT